jgi:hypothetical protein
MKTGAFRRFTVGFGGLDRRSSCGTLRRDWLAPKNALAVSNANCR